MEVGCFTVYFVWLLYNKTPLVWDFWPGVGFPGSGSFDWRSVRSEVKREVDHTPAVVQLDSDTPASFGICGRCHSPSCVSSLSSFPASGVGSSICPEPAGDRAALQRRAERVPDPCGASAGVSLCSSKSKHFHREIPVPAGRTHLLKPAR